MDTIVAAVLTIAYVYNQTPIERMEQDKILRIYKFFKSNL